MVSNQTAIITGAARGIGAAISDAFLAIGFQIVVNDVDEASLMSRYSAYDQSKILVVAGDLTLETTVENIVESTKGNFGTLDLLVNNAGISGPIGTDSTTIDDFRRVLETNVIAPFNLSRRCRDLLGESQYGSIVNVASTASFRSTRMTPIPAYDSSKGAIASLTRSLAVEWAPQGIRVNAVAPGPLKTELSFPLSSENEAKKLAPIPMARRGLPEEVADVVVFLASRAARYITGQIIVTDGGMLA